MQVSSYRVKNSVTWLKMIKLSSDCQHNLTGNKTKISQAGWRKGHGGLWERTHATCLLRKAGARGGMPNPSPANELPLSSQ